MNTSRAYRHLKWLTIPRRYKILHKHSRILLLNGNDKSGIRFRLLSLLDLHSSMGILESLMIMDMGIILLHTISIQIFTTTLQVHILTFHTQMRTIILITPTFIGIISMGIILMTPTELVLIGETIV